MLDRLDELRRESETKRKRIALFWSAGITLILFIAWMLTFPSRFSGLSGTATSTNQTASPLDSLKEEFTEGIDSLKETFTDNPFTPETGSTSTPEASPSTGIIIEDVI